MLLNTNPILSILLLVGGIILLWKSADILVQGAVGLANHFRISQLVIGLTIVAMGTSAPEVAASIAASIRDSGDIAVGNVYGSNIANLALVGGLCSIISPIAIQSQAIKREIPAMIMTALLLFPFLYDGKVTMFEGLALLLVFTALLTFTIYSAKKQKISPVVVQTTEIQNVPAKLNKELVFIVAGLAGLAIGADLTLRGAINIGHMIGLSQAVIGLTIVAVGTSLPELVTSFVAGLKGHSDISIGNLVGSNIFNTLLVIGIASTVRTIDITQRLKGTDYIIMISVSLIFGLLALLGKNKITRVNGIILLTIYLGYMTYLLLFTAAV